MYPPHDTRTASPGTELSFRGVSAADLGVLEVVGADSGAHAGVFHDHADGQGTSFVPDAPFLPGEWVSVRASGLQLRPVPRGVVTFQVAVPAAPVETPVTQETDHPKVPPQAFRTRPDLLPPAMSVTNRSNALAPGLIFLGAKIEDGINGAMILDNFAEVVWFAPVDQGVAVHNDVRVQSYQGQPVITMWEGIAKLGTGFGHLVLLNDRYERIATVQAGNGYPGVDQHECVLTDRGTALFIVYNPVRWNLLEAGGGEDDPTLDGVIQEVEIATGRVVFEWHSLDHIELDEAERPRRAVGLCSPQLGPGHRRRSPHRLGPAHPRRLLHRARHRPHPVAPQWQQERFPDGRGIEVRLPARCPPPSEWRAHPVQ
jgi:hypothetical protein